MNAIDQHVSEPITATRTHVFQGAADRPVFIGGLMRSGTSLTRVLLSQHRDLFGTFETHWFSDSLRLHWDDTSSRRMELLLSLLGLSEDVYKILVERKRKDPKREFVDIVMEHCTTEAGKQRWVEKTPDNIRFWRLIRKQWPNAYLIHVTREYKDVFASWKTKRRETLDRFLDITSTVYDDIKDLLGTDQDHYMEVDYSELVLDTENAMRRILAKIGAQWDPNCAALNLDDTTTESDRVKAVLGRESPTAKSLTQPIFQSGLGQWHQHLTAQEARRIDDELAPYYDIYGAKWETQT